jgi:hypothetical protein
MMQTSSTTLPHTIAEFARFALATGLANLLGGGMVLGILKLYLDRRKPRSPKLVEAAEIHESEARTARAFAEVRSLDLQTNISAGDAVLRMIQQLTFKQLELERLANENEAYEKQIQWAKAIFKVRGIPWNDDPK